MNNPTLEIKNKFEKKLRQILSLPEVKVIDFKTVGYPFYRISLNVIIRENRKLNLIEEFILKSIQSGLDTLEEIASFLGLEQYIVNETIGKLSQELIKRKDESEESAKDFKLTLTEQGQQCLELEIVKETINDNISVLIDGLTGKIYSPHDFNFNNGKKCENKLKRIVRKPNRPEDFVIYYNDIQKMINYKYTKNQAELIDIIEVDQLFPEWHKIDIVLYKTNPADTVVSYRTFSRNYSDESKYKKAMDEQNLDPIETIFKYELSNVDEKSLIEESWFNREHPSQPVTESFTLLKDTIDSLTRKDIPTDDIHRNISEITQTINSLITSNKSEQEPLLEMIHTLDHRNYLQQALKAKDRLLIVSPWITKYVVNDEFLKKLEELLKDNVKVHIIYGIKERFGQSQNDPVAIDKLRKLSDIFDNFVFKKVDNTHAKNLVCDDQFAIVSSFNFLSFRGDPKLTYRDEVGIVVRNKVFIDNFYSDRLLLI